MRRALNISGQKFGRLTALARVENKGRMTVWRCRCDCGTEVDIRLNNLQSGASASCGCLRKERLRAHHAEWRARRARERSAA